VPLNCSFVLSLVRTDSLEFEIVAAFVAAIWGLLLLVFFHIYLNRGPNDCFD
jgi:hypothetical protein